MLLHLPACFLCVLHLIAAICPCLQDPTAEAPQPPSERAVGTAVAALLAALPLEAGLRDRWAAHALHWALTARSPHLAARSHQVRPSATAAARRCPSLCLGRPWHWGQPLPPDVRTAATCFASVFDTPCRQLGPCSPTR